MTNKDKRKIVDTEISIHPEVKDRISDFQKQCLIDEIKSLPPIKEGEINISTDYIFDMGDNYEVSIFIRNGLAKSIVLDNMEFVVINEKKQILGKKTFNLREAGGIPAHTVRPWKICFEKEEIALGKNDVKKLKVLFNTKGTEFKKSMKVEFENLPSKISYNDKQKYTKFLEGLPIIEDGQFSMCDYDVNKTKEGGISVTVVIRNGVGRKINIEKVPLTIFDADKKMIASGTFYLDNVAINPYKARIYKFSFAKEELYNQDINLKKWEVKFDAVKNISTGDEKNDEEK
ncbi:SLAP domain-containing protein [Clostridium aestuarii]|uniref:SLAP domain-containing protein n=1 Tax=Clostridium aestuarii TaxID=338193 RepID=A0ABT4CZW8_9CLOT|nr:SLAP domain-containing protein [Clostridium aestuarii]MCY6484530.1 SLAP domain-containing protein [Clostridium aestuarii]